MILKSKDLYVIHVGVIDNDSLTLKALEALFARFDDIAVAWVDNSGVEAIRRCLDLHQQPDIVLLDMSLTGMSGVEVCRRIRRETSEVPILAMTAFSINQYANAVSLAGAQGIIGKDDMTTLIQSVRRIAQGNMYMDGFENTVTAHIRIMYETSNDRKELSDKESEVMAKLEQGLSTVQISSDLKVSVSTIKKHIERAKQKLGAESLRQALSFWRQSNEHKS